MSPGPSMTDEPSSPEEASLLDGAPWPDGRRRSWRDERSAVAVVVGVWLASRAAVWAAGVRFDSRMFTNAMQLADPVWLRADPVRSVWYLHTQPPGFNLLSAALLATSHEHTVAQALFHLVGLAMVLGAYMACRGLGLGRAAATVVAAVLAVRPDLLLYEHWYFYTFIEAAILVGILVAFTRWGPEPRTMQLLTVGVGLAALAGLHALFGPWWLAGVAAILLRRVGLRRAAICVAPAVLLIGAVMMKNWIVFDHATMSSWQGTNLARITTNQLSEHERRSLVAAGKLSRSALEPSWSVHWDDPSVPHPKVAVGPAVKVAVLDAPRKPTGGEANYNHRWYLARYDSDLADATWVIRHRPGVWLRGMWRSWGIYFNPSDDNLRMIDNLDAVSAYRTAWRVPLVQPRTSLGQFDPSWERDSWRGVQFGEVVASVLAAAALWLRRWRRHRTGSAITSPEWLTLAFVTWCVVGTAVVANAVELGENNRFRLAVVPVTVIGAAVAIRELVLLVRTPTAAPTHAAAGDESARADAAPDDEPVTPSA